MSWSWCVTAPCGCGGSWSAWWRCWTCWTSWICSNSWTGSTSDCCSGRRVAGTGIPPEDISEMRDLNRETGTDLFVEFMETSLAGGEQPRHRGGDPGPAAQQRVEGGNCLLLQQTTVQDTAAVTSPYLQRVVDPGPDGRLPGPPHHLLLQARVSTAVLQCSYHLLLLRGGVRPQQVERLGGESPTLHHHYSTLHWRHGRPADPEQRPRPATAPHHPPRYLQTTFRLERNLAALLRQT